MYEYEEVNPDDIQVGDWVTIVFGVNNSQILSDRLFRNGIHSPWPNDYLIKGREDYTFKMSEEKNLERTYDYPTNINGALGPRGYTWVRRKMYKPYDPEQVGDQEDDL